jgi:hypothetical protein
MPGISMNKSESLKPPTDSGEIGWVSENTAMLVIHGIGNQMPLQTLDEFGRGLVKQYRGRFGGEFEISHRIIVKTEEGDGEWFDNALRLSKKGSDHFVDIYEYYWADYTQDKATWNDMNVWLQGVVSGAEKFYKRNGEIGQQYKDKSIFFDPKTGRFKVGTYRFFLFSVGRIFLVLDELYRGLIWLVGRIPFLGNVATSLLESYAAGVVHNLTNIISEVCIYNVVDPKSKFYSVRRLILDNAVGALQYLIERGTTDDGLYYPSVIVAGHSLGTQIAYDAINKIDLLVNEGLVKRYGKDGKLVSGARSPLAAQLRGFITFGSPLDKVVFFLRENVSDEDYIWQQFLDNYHHFKMRNLDFDNNPHTNPDYLKAACNLSSLLESVKWRNYFDHHDYVSGSLDYYTRLTNVDCHFKSGRFGFTHSYYWSCIDFYDDIITHFLQTRDVENG